MIIDNQIRYKMRKESSEIKNEIAATQRLIIKMKNDGELGITDTDDSFYDYQKRLKSRLSQLKKMKN